MLLLALVVTWVSFGHIPLFDEDEGEYAEVAVEMARSGDFVTPTLNGQAFFEKPILAFWLEAPLVQALGVHAWVFRLPSLLACLLWVLLLVRFGRREWGETAGWAAGFFCATALGVIVSADAAAMDGVLCLFVTAAGFDIYKAWKTSDRRAEWRVFLWMALGFLAKGPVAVVVPLLVSFLFYLSQRELARWLKSAFNPWGWATFLMVALPWYVIQYQRMGPAFLDYFLLRENLGRLTGALQGHGGSLLYYVPVALLIVLPHTTLLLRAGLESWRTRGEPLTRFLGLWFIVVFLLFSLANTKLPHYLLIGLTPAFLLMARHRELLRSRWRILLPWGAMVTLALALPGTVAWAAQRDHHPYLHEMLARGPTVFTQDYYWVRIALLLGVFFAGLTALWAIARKSPWYLLLLTGVASNILVWGILLPVAAGLQQAPVLEAARLAKDLGQPVVADNRMPSFAVYSGQPTTNRPPRTGDLVFLRVDREAQLPAHEVLFAQGGVRLVRITAAAGLPPPSGN